MRSLPIGAWAQTLAQLVEGAKVEKEMLTYAMAQAAVMKRLVQGFNKRYPFIKIDYNCAGAEQIAQRFDTGVAAGRRAVELVNRNSNSPASSGEGR